MNNFYDWLTALNESYALKRVSSKPVHKSLPGPAFGHSIPSYGSKPNMSVVPPVDEEAEDKKLVDDYYSAIRFMRASFPGTTSEEAREHIDRLAEKDPHYAEMIAAVKRKLASSPKPEFKPGAESHPLLMSPDDAA